MHKTNSPESQGNITYAVLQMVPLMYGFVRTKSSFRKKDEGPQGMEADEIYFKVSAGVVPKEEIVADLDFWFDQLKDKEEGCNADYLSIETYRAEKKKEISQICQSTVFSGTDIDISSGKEHFSLKDEDQLNLFRKTGSADRWHTKNWNTMKTAIRAGIIPLRICRRLLMVQWNSRVITQHMETL